jgi:hypothetical protein
MNLKRWIALVEGRDAPLYHGTHLGAALEILRTNRIKANSYHEPSRLAGLGGMPSFDKNADSVTGVSLTRSREQALHFDFGEIVFELDQRKLSYTHKLIPFDYWGAGHLNEPNMRGQPAISGDKNEAEEFCVGPISPANKYIMAIYMNRKRHSYNTRHFAADVLRPLFDHPLFRTF